MAPAPPPGPDPHCHPPAELPPAPSPQLLATDPCSVTPQGLIFDTITPSPSPTSDNTNLAGLSDLTVAQANCNAYSPPRGSIIHIRCPLVYSAFAGTVPLLLLLSLSMAAQTFALPVTSLLLSTSRRYHPCQSWWPTRVTISPLMITALKVVPPQLTLDNGNLYWQLCYYCANVIETIISPQAVIATSNVFTSWTQTGYKDSRPGYIRFDSADGFLSMSLRLECINGLYYCTSDTYTIDPGCQPRINQIGQPTPQSHLRQPLRYRPTTKSKQLKSELWLLHLGSPGIYQLDHLPGNATGLPTEFDYHPFRFIDFKSKQ